MVIKAAGASATAAADDLTSKSPPSIDRIRVLLPSILLSEIIYIFKGTFIPENLAKLI